MSEENPTMRVAQLPGERRTVAQFWSDADKIIAARKEMRRAMKLTRQMNRIEFEVEQLTEKIDKVEIPKE